MKPASTRRTDLRDDPVKPALARWGRRPAYEGDLTGKRLRIYRLPAYNARALAVPKRQPQKGVVIEWKR